MSENDGRRLSRLRCVKKKIRKSEEGKAEGLGERKESWRLTKAVKL